MVIKKYYNFILFVLYTIKLKDPGSYEPKIVAAASISLFHILVLVFTPIFLSLVLFDLMPFSKAFATLLILAIFIYDYYSLVKKGKLERIYKQFESSDLNTTQNFRIVKTCLILYLALVPLGIILHSYLKSL